MITLLTTSMFACNRNYQENNNIKKDQENNDLKKEGLRGNVSSIRQLKYQVIGKNTDSLLIKKGKSFAFRRLFLRNIF